MGKVFSKVADIVNKILNIQQDKLVAAISGEVCEKAKRKEHDALCDELSKTMEEIRLNDSYVGGLIEELDNKNKELIAQESKLLKLTNPYSINRSNFLQLYLGNELNPNLLDTIK